MNDHDTQFDQHPHGVGPEIDDSVNPTAFASDDSGSQYQSASSGQSESSGQSASDQGPRSTAGREMLIQLQQMIDTVAVQAGPVMREVAAKAAELAAVAGEKAGPVAHRAAAVTESVGQRVAARSKVMAADLRRPRADGDETAAGTEGGTGAWGETGQPGTPESGPGESTERF
jgi:hypothetical protein